MKEIKKFDAGQLIDAIGFEGFKNLVKAFGGSYIYIPLEKSFLRDRRNAEIKKEYLAGESVKALSKKYGLSSSGIIDAIKSDKKKSDK